MQQKCTSLQEEVDALRGQFRGAKQQVKVLTGHQSKLQEAKRQQEAECVAMERELDGMRTLLETTNDHFKREGEARSRDVSKVKQGEFVVLVTLYHNREFESL